MYDYRYRNIRKYHGNHLVPWYAKPGKELIATGVFFKGGDGSQKMPLGITSASAAIVKLHRPPRTTTPPPLANPQPNPYREF